jgi:protease-4
MRGFYDWLGISNEYVLRGKTAGMFRETEKFSDEERVKFEEWIKTTYYQDFIPKVAKGRNKDAQFVDSVGQGRVWTGAQAKDRGLVDDLAGSIKRSRLRSNLRRFPRTRVSNV